MLLKPIFNYDAIYDCFTCMRADRHIGDEGFLQRTSRTSRGMVHAIAVDLPVFVRSRRAHSSRWWEEKG